MSMKNSNNMVEGKGNKNYTKDQIELLNYLKDDYITKRDKEYARSIKELININYHNITYLEPNENREEPKNQIVVTYLDTNGTTYKKYYIAGNDLAEQPSEKYCTEPDEELKIVSDVNYSVNGLAFGQALEAIKQGKLVAREGWNGKNMFLFGRDGATVVLDMVKTLPATVKKYYEDKEIYEAYFTPYICMKTADDSIVNGWLASQTDMAATDWVILK